MKIKIINPIEYTNWDQLLLTNGQATFFHSNSWARVLSESYSYKPIYFTIIDNAKIVALVPIMEIQSFLTGKRGVSLPFTDACPSIAEDEQQFKELLEHICEYGRREDWRYIELRGGHNCLKKILPYNINYSHILEIDDDDKKIFSSFKSSVKRNIKRSQKEDIHVNLFNSWESMRAFCRLNCITRKRHGLPPQPFSFFKKIFYHIISTGRGVISLAVHQKKTVAGAIFFHFGDQVIFKYGASDPKYLYLRPNNLIMWKAIKWYCHRGYKTFNFGRTEPENTGLLQFKRGWGTKEEMVSYYKYNLVKNGFVKEKVGIKSSYGFFKFTPTPILRFTGKILYRHVG